MRIIATSVLCWFLAFLYLGAVEEPPPTRVLIAFHSETGHTEAMARAVQEGVSSVEGVQATLRSVDQVDDREILESHGILVGTPVYWASLSAKTKEFLDRVGTALSGAHRLEEDGRTAGAFCTGGSLSSGKELARLAILAAFLNMRFIVIGGVEADGHGTLGVQATFPPEKQTLSPQEIEEARLSGERFARWTRRIHLSGVQ